MPRSEEALARLDRAAAERDARVSAGERRRRGVVHTPSTVARFMARCIADRPGTIVDPACGPGVFLAACMEELASPRRAIGMDVDREAIDDARAILGPTASRRGWTLTLETRDTLSSPLADVRGPLIVIGNPPWAGRSANRDASYTDALLDDFRRDARGEPLGERKIGVLSDDYVRFFRWACEALRRPEGGALAFVTNASFLDGPVHRGMRARLLRWFESVDVIELGGSALVARRGDRDENVFGVRPAAAITIAIRPPDHDEVLADARVTHVSLRGSRAQKLAQLAGTIELAAIVPRPPLLRFVPTSRSRAYDTWPSLPELMPFHREGLQTNRDAFCVDVDQGRLRERLDAFSRGVAREWPGRAGTRSPHYDPAQAQRALAAALGAAVPAVRLVAYRPFDDRFVCIVSKVCHRPRKALLLAMDRSSVALLTVRKDRGEQPWAHFGVTEHAVDNCYLSARSSCRTRAFPTHRPDGVPNLGAATYRSRFTDDPRALVRYVLAVLASPAYRSRFDDALRADYPRIPVPPSREAFDRCAKAGEVVERAFLRPRLAPGEFTLGHHRLARAAALRDAVDAADAAVVPLLE